MKVVFPYCANNNTSFGSPTGWDLNVANLFSLRGHEVYFGQEYVDSGEKADILFVYERLDLWEDERSKAKWAAYRECADKILLGVFDPTTHGHTSNVPEGCVLVTPFRDLGTQRQVLPYAYYNAMPEPKFSNKTLGWTVRNPFVGSGRPDTAQRVHLDHLRACCRLVQEGYRLIIFSNNTYSEFETVEEARALMDSMRDNPLVSTTDHLPYSEYLSLLGETSVVLPLNGIGSTTEALKLGLLPLAWENVVNIYSHGFARRKYLSLRYNVIYNTLLKFLTDEEVYRAEYQELLRLAAVYDLETSLGFLDQVIERL